VFRIIYILILWTETYCRQVYPFPILLGLARPFAYNNTRDTREGSYGSASSTGTLLAPAFVAPVFAGSSSLSVVPETQVFRFSQTTASANFSVGSGPFSGRSVLGVADDLSSGALSPNQVPVNFVQRGSFNLIDNTRSSIALQEAGIPMNQWNLVNRTGNPFFEGSVTTKLTNNGLTNTGTNTVRFNNCFYRCQ